MYLLRKLLALNLTLGSKSDQAVVDACDFGMA
jgi:hypothetical protein